MAVDLGNATNNVINIDGTGGITISSIIGGASRNLTKSGSGTGVLELQGQNTYTGTTTVSGGTLRLNRTGGTTLPTGNSVTVNNGGTLRISTTQTLGNVTVDAGGTLILDAGLTVSGTFIVNGTLQLNSGGFISTNAPTYGTGSTLIYNNSGSFNVGTEWTGNSTTAGLGIPHHVTIQNSTAVTMPSANRGMAGNMNISSGSLTLGSGDLYLAGNWTRASGTTFTPNNKAVFFNGSANQTITRSGTGTETFAYLVVDKSGGSLIFSSSPVTSVSVNGTSGGSTLQLLNGDINLNSQELTLTGTGNILVSGGARQIGGIGTVYLRNGNKTVSSSSGGSLVFGADANVWLGGTSLTGVNFGSSLTTINGILNIITNGFVDTNPPIYGSASTLQYNTGGPFSVSSEWTGNSTTAGLGVPNHVTIAGATSVSMPASNRGLAGDMTLDNNSALTLNADLYVGGDWSEGIGSTFTPNSRAVVLNGAGEQYIASDNSSGNTFAYLNISKSGGNVNLLNDITVTNTLTFAAGNVGNIDAGGDKVIVTNNNTAAVVRTGSGHVIGDLTRTIGPGSNTYFFPVGTDIGYTPVSIAFTNVTTHDDFTVNSNDGQHPDFANYGLSATKYINRYWSIDPGITDFTSANATFTFLSGDRVGGVMDSELKTAKYDGFWEYPATATAANQFTAQNLSIFSDFMAGACKLLEVEASSNSPVCVGGTILLSATPMTFSGSPNFSWEGPNSFTSNDQDPTITGATLAMGGTYTVTMTDGTNCTDVATTVVSVVAQPTGPTLDVKSPNVASVCTGTSVSATFNAGSGGVGCSDDYRVIIDGTPAVYMPGNPVGGSATSSIVIQGRRDNCTGSGCTGTTYVTLASWTVNPLPSVGCVPPDGPFCVYAAPFALNFGSPAGGTYSGAGVSAGMFSPSVAGIGSHPITYTYTDGNGCTKSCMFNIQVADRPNAGTISGGTAVCQGSMLNLSSNGLSGGTWSSNNGNATVGAMSGVVTGVTHGTSIITYMVTDANLCTSATNVTITVDQTATAAGAGAGQSICSDAFAVLAANAPSVGTGAWSVSGPSSANSQFSSVSSPTATFTPAGGPGTYTLIWTITNGTCSSSDEMEIEAISCLCESSAADDAVYNDGWQTGDNDNPTGFGAWTLSLTSGDGSQNGHFAGSSVGNNGCADGNDSNSDGDINTSSRAWGMYANSGQTASAVRTFAPMSVNSSLSIRMDNGCVGSGGPVVGLGLRNASNNTLTEFYFVGGGSFYRINDESLTTTTVPFTDEGLEIRYDVTSASTYTLYVTTLQTGTVYAFPGRTFKTVSGGQAPAQIRFFNFNAGSGPNNNVYFNNLRICRACTPSTASLNGAGSICQNGSTNLSVSISGGTSPYTVVYSNGMTNSTVTGYNSDDNISVSPTATTTYTLVSVTDSEGCAASISGGDATVTVNNLPTITASSNSPVCVGSNILLTSTPAGGSGTYNNFAWQGPNSYTASGQNPTGFPATMTAAGTYTVTVTDNNNCTGSKTTIVAVQQQPTTSVAGSNQTICGDQCAVLAANTPSVGTGAWSIMLGAPSTSTSQFSDVNAPNATFCPDESGDYTLVWTISNGVCAPSSSSIEITALDCGCRTSVAHEYEYNDGWQTGDDDGGITFDSWILGTTGGSGSQNGHFIGNSTNNNACASPSGDTNGDNDISLFGEAWGIYANDGFAADAVRPFGDPVGKGGKVSIHMDNGCVQTGGTVGITLQNSSGNVLAEFYLVGGDANYTVNDAAVSNSGVAFTDEGLIVEYTVTGLSTYDLKITRLATGAVTTLTGRTFKNPAGGQAPGRIRPFNANAGSGANNDAYFNQLRLCEGCPVYTATISGTTTICPGNSTNLSVSLSGGTGDYTLVYTDGTTNFTVNNYESGSDIPVSPSTTTTYTVVSVTDASNNLCPGVPTSSATVTVHPTVSITAANNGPVCIGNNIILTSTPSGGSGTYNSFSWQGPNAYTASVEDPTAFPATAAAGGTYTVTVTDSNNCPASAQTTVTVNPLPNAGTISGTLSVCTSATTTLSSNGDSGGTWSSSNGNATVGTMTGVVTGVTAGTSVITYTVTDGNGCVSSTMVTVTVNTFTAYTPVFTESMGTTTTTTPIATHESNNAFDNDPFTMTGTGDVRGTSASSGYTGASGGANVFFTASGRTFQIEGINTTAFSSLGLSFGLFKSPGTTNGTGMTVEVSTDGSTYTALTFAPLAIGQNWFLVSASGSIPSTANLRIRFTSNSGTEQFRIDDVQLSGLTAAAPTITPSGPTTFCQGGSVMLAASGGSSWLWSNSATTQAITVTMTGAYSVQVTDASGCTASAGPVNVTVNSNPSVAPAPASVCIGSTVMVNGNPSGGSGTYTTHTWTNLGTGTATGVTLSNASTQTVTVSATGAGTINLRYQVTDNNGCNTSGTVTVTANARPTAAPAAASVCTGFSVNVNGNPSGGSGTYPTHAWTDLGTGTATGYTLSNTTAQTVTVDASAATAGSVNLRYQVTDGNGCTGTANVTVTINSFGVVSQLFTERIGTISGNPTSITAHETANGFDNDPFTMTGTGTAELRNSLPSSGYAGASGTGNFYLDQSGTPAFQIAGINTVGLNPVSISFGVKKEANDQNGSALRIEVSSDGTTYTILGSPTLPTGSGTATNWHYVTVSGSIPATANLRIRFTNLNTGATTNQFRIDDISLNTSSSTLTITPSGPTAFCTGSSVVLTSSVAPSYLWSTSETTQAITVTTSGTYTVVATDLNTCTKSASQVVTVAAQPVGPTLNAKSPNTATVCEGSNVSATINPGTGGVGCSDTYEYSTNNGGNWQAYTPGSNISTTGATVVLIRAKRDGCTSGTGCSGTSFVQLADWTVNTAPTFTACPNAPVVVGTHPSTGCTATASYSVAANGSPTPVLTYTFTGATIGSGSGTGSGSTFEKGNTTVTVTATNVCGAPTCVFTVTVNDDDAPTVTCPAANTTINVNSNTCQITIPDYVASLNPTDNCTGTITEAQDIPAGAYGPVSNGQTVTVTYSATDPANNTRYCTVSILVNAPEADVRGNGISIADEDGTPDLDDFTNMGGTTIGVPLNRTFVIHNTGALPLTIGTIMLSNNTNFTASLTPGGPIAPGGTADLDITFTSGVQGVFTSNLSIQTNDCDENPYNFALSAAAGCIPADIITCPSPAPVNAATGLCSAVVNYTVAASGNPASTLTYSLTGATTGTGSGTGSGLAFNVGATTVTVTATNACGTDVCTFTVTVVDAQDPTITCPSNINRNTDPNQCSALVSYAAMFSDNCPGAAVSVVTGVPSGSAFPKGTTPVTLRVTDAANRTAECSFSVTVTDAQQPNISCPANIVRNTDVNQCSAVVSFATPTPTDNCSPAPTVVQTSGLPSGSAFPVGITQVKFKATDGANLTRECTFNVTVNDAQLPSIACPSNIVANTAAGACTAAVTYSAPTVSDNCPAPPAVAYHHTGATTSVPLNTFLAGTGSGSTFNKGITTVTFRATDGAGLTKTCTFRITVNDTEPPSITCTPVPPVNAAPNTCAAIVNYPTPTATDNCPGALTVIRIGGPASGSSFPVGATTVIWRAIDAAGRSSTCSFAVTVVDNQLPSIVCPGNISATGSGSACTATVNYATPTATDNCPGSLTPHLLTGLASGSVFPAGTTVNTWRVIASNGLSSTCSFSVSVSCSSAPNGGVNAGNMTARAMQRELGVVEIFPNPTSGVFNLNLSGFEQQVLTTIFDATGRQVWQQQLEPEQTQVTVDLSDARFSAGLYMVTVASDGTVLTKRVVLQR